MPVESINEGPELLTKRLRLRRWQADDLSPFAVMNADEAVMEFFPSTMDRAASDDFARRIEAAFDERGYGLWAVEVVDDRERALVTGDGSPDFIGFVGLQHTAAGTVPSGEPVEIGWRLARHAWGRGYATEAAQACLAFGFEQAGLDEIVSFTSVVNTRSRSVMERIGLHRDPADDFDHPRVPVGSPLRPHVLYRLTADEWRSASSQARHS